MNGSPAPTTYISPKIAAAPSAEQINPIIPRITIRVSMDSKSLRDRLR